MKNRPERRLISAFVCALSMAVALGGLSFGSAAVAQSATAALYEGAVYSSAQSDAQSFLRLYNSGITAGTVTVTLTNFATGQTLAQWTSPSIAPGAAPQFDITTIEGANPSFTKPAYYAVSVQSRFNGTFQHVMVRKTAGALSNLTACSNMVTAPATVIDVHSSLLASGYPSSIVINHTAKTAETAVLGIYNSDTGAKLGSYTTASIPAGGGLVLPVSTIENGAGISTAKMSYHYNVVIEGPFTGYLEHRINNVSAGTTVDMTLSCALQAVAGTSATTFSASFVTAAATTEQASMCKSNTFPTQWEWDATQTAAQAKPATSGTPKVEQYRDGIKIATYASLGSGKSCSIPQNAVTKPNLIPANCGPFGRSHVYRTWQPGDLFLVYPAVYTGDENQPWVGPLYDNDAEYYAGTPPHIPTNITIRGVTVDGVRPVLMATTASYTTLNQSAIYVDASVGVTVENIDVDATGATNGGKGLIYTNGGKDTTFRDMRVHGGQGLGINGVFATSGNTGTLKLERVELYDNGGTNGPSHNLYINASATDPDYTFHFLNSWSHNSNYGHLLKSRAQVTKVEGSYLSGSVPTGSVTQAEPYLIDVPDGGRLTVRNSVLVKNASGTNSNGILLAYAMESFAATRTHSVTIENNTFVAFTKFYDGSHQVYPMNLTYPAKIPGAANFPVMPTSIQRNAFVGFCPGVSAAADYRGDLSLTAAFSELNSDYSLKTKYPSTDTSILGSPGYEHPARGGTRQTTAIGARD